MKKLIFLLLVVFSVSVFGQFKEDSNVKPNIKDRLTTNYPSDLMLGFINPNNLSMNHSFSMSYSAIGGGGAAMGVYTNQLNYDFSKNLSLTVETSIINSPYNSFGQGFSDQINGIYLSRAALNYRISENSAISVQFRSLPAGSYYSPYGYGSYGGFGSSSFFDDFNFRR